MGQSSLFQQLRSPHERPAPELPAEPADLLFRAAYRGEDEQLAKLLHQPGASPDSSNASDHGTTLLQYAAIAGHVSTCKLLLEHGASIDKIGRYSVTPLVVSIQYGQTATMEWLVASGANKEWQDERGSRPLMFAADKCDLRMIDLLLAAGADVNHCVDDDLFRNSALHIAAARGEHSIVEILLENNALPNLRCPGRGRTALAGAAFGGHAETIRVLLSAGADVNAIDSTGVSPLAWALREQRNEAARLLQSAGARIGLIEAILLNDGQALHQTLALAHEPEAGVFWGESLLEIASERGFDATVSTLLETGRFSKPQQEDALVKAAEGAHVNVMKALIDTGVNINAQVGEGRTALMAAAESGDSDAVKFLLAHDADPEVVDFYRQSALDYATTSDIELLVYESAKNRHGARKTQTHWWHRIRSAFLPRQKR